MLLGILAVVNPNDILIFGFAILGVFFLMFGLFWFGWWLSHRQACLSPYSNMPLRRGSDLSYYNIERVLRYLYELHQYENRIFDIRKAAVCRETGRIFYNSITWFDTISVDWSFLQKRFPGQYVSWGSLTKDQQDFIRSLHDPIEGFQMDHSSSHPVPRAVEPQYALQKPGPLYVDIDKHVLLGWKIVPDTELEVLIVQRPKLKIPEKFTAYEPDKQK